MPQPWEKYQQQQGPWSKYGAPPPSADLAQHVDQAPEPSATSRFGSSLARGVGVVSPEEGKNFFAHPIDTLKGMGEAQANLGRRAGSEFKGGDYLGAATHGIEYLLPGIGPTLAHAGDQLESGDTAGGVGTTLGAALPIALGNPAVRAIPGKVATVAPQAGAAVVRGAAKGANKILARAPGAVGATVGGTLGHYTGIPGASELGAAAGWGAGGEVLPKIRIPGENFGIPKAPPVYPGAPFPEHPGVFPGAQYPEAPPVVVQQARALAQGGKPYVDPAAGLGRLPAKVVTPEPAPVRPAVAAPQPVAVRAPQVAAEDPAEFTRRTGLAEPAPVAVPGENKVPVAARASSQIRKAEQEGLAAKIEGRGAAKEALEKTPPVAQPTVAWDTGPRPVIQRGPIPGSRADRLETSILKDEVRSAAEGEERTINSQNKREWFARNQPGSSKGELTGASEKPVKYSRTPGVSSPKPGTTVPAPDEDLTPILRKSLVAARRKRASQ